MKSPVAIVTLKGLSDLDRFIQAWAPQIQPGDLVLLIGPVGAGKTECVRRLLTHWGCDEVASPTYALHHHYDTALGLSVDHVDLYRLEDEDDLESTGFWDLIADEDSILMVEWADRLEVTAWPLHRRKWVMNFEILDPQTRRLSWILQEAKKL